MSTYCLLKEQYPIDVPFILSSFGGFGVESREAHGPALYP